jgi:hypothetical protein
MIPRPATPGCVHTKQCASTARPVRPKATVVAGIQCADTLCPLNYSMAYDTSLPRSLTRSLTALVSADEVEGGSWGYTMIDTPLRTCGNILQISENQQTQDERDVSR